MDFGIEKAQADFAASVQKTIKDAEVQLDAIIQKAEDRLLSYADTHRIVLSIEKK